MNCFFYLQCGPGACLMKQDRYISTHTDWTGSHWKKNSTTPIFFTRLTKNGPFTIQEITVSSKLWPFSTGFHPLKSNVKL